MGKSNMQPESAAPAPENTAPDAPVPAPAAKPTGNRAGDTVAWTVRVLPETRDNVTALAKEMGTSAAYVMQELERSFKLSRMKVDAPGRAAEIDAVDAALSSVREHYLHSLTMWSEANANVSKADAAIADACKQAQAQIAAETQRMQAKLDKAKGDIERLTEDLKFEKKQAEVARTLKESAQTALKAVRDKQETESAAMTASLEREKERVMSLQSALAQEQETTRQLRTELAKVRDQAAAAIAKVDAKDRQIAQLQEQFLVLSTTLTVATADQKHQREAGKSEGEEPQQAVESAASSDSQKESDVSNASP